MRVTVDTLYAMSGKCARGMGAQDGLLKLFIEHLIDGRHCPRCRGDSGK